LCFTEVEEDLIVWRGVTLHHLGPGEYGTKALDYLASLAQPENTSEKRRENSTTGSTVSESANTSKDPEADPAAET
jgi:hypothetical protein